MTVHSLDRIINKDAILTDASKMNPTQKAAFDIKYQLFNKDLSSHSFQLKKREEQMKHGSNEFHSKILIEITKIFHLFSDLRHHYLMSNNIEFFYKNIYSKWADQDEITDGQIAEINKEMLKEFVNLIPDSPTFCNHLDYELPSIDKMYDNNELDIFKGKLIKTRKENEIDDLISDELDVKNMHFEYVTLMIDTFNLHSYNPYLRQLIILLICRYHSERSEFMRNLDRTLLFFDKNDWKFYRWAQQLIDKFVDTSEKSSIWLLKIKYLLNEKQHDELEELEINEDLFNLLSILKDFKDAIIFDCTIEQEGDEFILKSDSGDRKIKAYAQNLYRNIKIYDYMINFLFQNRDLLILTRRIDMNSLKGNKLEIVKVIRKMFRRIFRVLEVMTDDNPTTQGLMWKYKEAFIFEELEEIEQEGELQLVLAIINDSPDAIKYQQNKWTLTKTR